MEASVALWGSAESRRGAARKWVNCMMPKYGRVVCQADNESAELRRLRELLKTDSGDSLKLLQDLENNPLCSVTFDESVPCVTVSWRNYVTSTQYRFILESILSLVRKHRAHKILADDTALPIVHLEDQNWVRENWWGRALEAGLRIVATKAPEAYFGKVDVSALQASAPRDFIIRTFGNIEDARNWLSRQRKWTV